MGARMIHVCHELPLSYPDLCFCGRTGFHERGVPDLPVLVTTRSVHELPAEPTGEDENWIMDRADVLRVIAQRRSLSEGALRTRVFSAVNVSITCFGSSPEVIEAVAYAFDRWLVLDGIGPHRSDYLTVEELSELDEITGRIPDSDADSIRYLERIGQIASRLTPELRAARPDRDELPHRRR